MKKRTRTRQPGGFTLVELMVVVVILGLLATLVAKNVIPFIFRSSVTAAKMDIKNISEAVDLYRTNNHGKLPESLEELIEPDENGETYLKDMTQVPKDPWGNEYQLEEDPDRKGGYIIRSFGPDGEPETDDDITNLNLHDSPEQGR
ncbi:MAG TPA: type II secretion system protein GspG [Planctomycetes bacterium]|nr:type II secretion system protein GspG [Planctomycetota bacterium]